VGAVLVAVALAVAIVLALPGQSHDVHAPASARAGAPRRASLAPPTPRRPVYASVWAPASRRVTVRFKVPPRAGLMWDVRSGQVLWARDPGRVLPIASLTKMMTAILAVDSRGPDVGVLVTKQALAYQGSGVGVLPRGRRIAMETMLYGLLLPSGNDAAIAIAQNVAGTVGRFVAEMNDRARTMALACTHFTSPSGFQDAGNHSCARDLALLAHALLLRPRLARIVGTRRAALPFPIKGGKLWLYNNNPLLLARYPGTDGVKTGYTEHAGQCLVATVRRGGRWLGVVLLHSPDSGLQAEKLFDAAFPAPPRRARVRSIH